MNEPIGSSLHAGTAGIALFLAECARVCGASRWAPLAAGAIEDMLDGVASTRPDALGCFTGRIGHAHAAARVGDILGEPRWRDRARALLAPVVHAHEIPQSLDAYSGVAGTVVPLLALADAFDWPEAADLAVRLGDQLVRRGTRSTRGLSWGLGARWPVHLTGYAHGASGGGHALLELSAATGRREFREAALDAFRYERAFFDASAENWLDLSTPEMQVAAMRAIDIIAIDAPVAAGIPVALRRYAAKWCHGAAGIGLVRLRAARRIASAQLESEAIASVRATAASIEPFARQGRYSLCHGVAGNLQTLTAAIRRAGAADTWVDAARAAHGAGVRTVVEAIASADRGRIAGVFDPGLMTGLPGLGWSMLREIDPVLPSFLLPTAGPDPT